MGRKLIIGTGTIVKSFSYQTTQQVVIDEVVKLANKENLYFGEIVMKALEEYAKTHGDGNPSFTMDQFFDKGFQACPSFFRPIKAWDAYFDNLGVKDLTAFQDQLIRIDHKLIQKMRNS